MTRTAAVTGATGGIGSAVSAALDAGGWDVVALRRGEPVPQVERLDALVHCAGIAPVASIEDSARELWTETLEANVIGPAETTRSLLSALRAARGHVVFVNAAPGLRGVAKWSAYVGSKAALRELADSLREEETGNGIRVTSIYPGGVRTALLRKVREGLGRPYDEAKTILPETLASLVLSILEFPEDAEILEVSLRARMR
jgi:NADP-dependent 3-hydroxy acid dehydrogenase YdfG